MQDSKITISEDPKDLKSLKGLAERCLDNYALENGRLKERTGKDGFTALFAIQNGKKVGFITGYSEEKKMHIWLFGVLAQKRGKGIGKKLLEAFHKHASEKGYRAVTTITFNKYAQKIILSLKSGYKITEVKYIPEKND